MRLKSMMKERLDQENSLFKRMRNMLKATDYRIKISELNCVYFKVYSLIKNGAKICLR